MSWSEGRYQTRQVFLHNTAVDLTGSAADIVAVPVVLPQIELRSFGLSYAAASASVTTAAKVSIDRLKVNAAWGAGVGTREELGVYTTVLSAVADAAQYDVVETSLDANAADQFAGASFPVAYKGDIIFLEHKQQGNGTQSAKPFYKWRELDGNKAEETDGPSA